MSCEPDSDAPWLTWRRLCFALQAVTPVVYALPFRCIARDMAPIVNPKLLPPNTPVVILPGTLHGALGYRLDLQGRLNLLKSLSEAITPRLILEPPTSPSNSILSITIGKAGRSIGKGWHAPQDWVGYQPGERLDFGVKLLDADENEPPDVARAVLRTVHDGFGARILADRKGSLKVKGTAYELAEWKPDDCIANTTNIRIRFHTPFVREQEGKLAGNGKVDWEAVRPPSFEELWKAVRQRIFESKGSILRVHGRRVPTEDERPSRSLDLQVTSQLNGPSQAQVWRLHFDPQRSTSVEPLFALGFVGDITYSGPVATFTPWLQLAGELGIGCWTQIGLGRFNVSAEVC